MAPLSYSLRSMRAGAVTGAACGALFLGAGGRLAMFGFALATGRPAVVTLSGSLNVVIAGATAGGLGGLLLPFAFRVLPGRPVLRALCFTAAAYLIASPGFRPPTLLVYGLFAPAFLTYGLASSWAFGRLFPSRPSNVELKPTAAVRSLAE